MALLRLVTREKGYRTQMREVCAISFSSTCDSSFFLRGPANEHTHHNIVHVCGVLFDFRSKDMNPVPTKELDPFIAVLFG